jgi:predicted RNase H-like nuclease
MSSKLVAGVDGSRSGWAFVIVDAAAGRVQACSVAPTFSELLLQTTSCEIVGIAVPIGLPDTVPRRGRSADREARGLLRPMRHASVFTVPPRAVLQARSYEEANELHRAHSEGGIGMSRQAYGILPKIAEVDDLMTPRLQRRILEVHPELSFMELNGGAPLPLARSNAGGALARLRLLGDVGLTSGLNELVGDLGQTRLDDLLDAVAVAWTAVRVVCEQAVRIPSVEEVDVRGLRMEMWR